ncbi:hypothetical protein L2E82_33305 [Cichorium intybus]|uniref:Uncharacterized protein n=1 Tax=Cichorium intybus TaxID=13427 RepID=A0ACB9BK18_CICIN|nr:hypothetical protein L2E82_33305 [Cichorium intybus]
MATKRETSKEEIEGEVEKKRARMEDRLSNLPRDLQLHILSSLDSRINCPFLGPRSGAFKNLKILHLEGAIITDIDPFSGFLVLEKLTLVDCGISPSGKTLSVHALNLSELTIRCNPGYKCCELTAPKLKFFEYRGYVFPQLRIHEDLSVLETMVIGDNGVCDHSIQEKRTFDDLLSLFCAFPNAKSLKLFSRIVHVLSLFQHE